MLKAEPAFNVQKQNKQNLFRINLNIVKNNKSQGKKRLQHVFKQLILMNKDEDITSQKRLSLEISILLTY